MSSYQKDLQDAVKIMEDYVDEIKVLIKELDSQIENSAFKTILEEQLVEMRNSSDIITTELEELSRKVSVI